MVDEMLLRDGDDNDDDDADDADCVAFIMSGTVGIAAWFFGDAEVEIKCVCFGTCLICLYKERRKRQKMWKTDK